MSVQDFVWFGEYLDGSYIAEFKENGMKVDFYSIKRNMLKMFSLVGHGNKLGFHIDSGTFELNRALLNISYIRDDGKTYQITGSRMFGDYSDIVTYKDAYADSLKFASGEFASSTISQYNLGFKKKLTFEDGVTFHVKVLIQIPYNEPARLEVRIVSSEDMNGNLIIEKLGSRVEPIQAPLKKEYAGVCHWNIK